MDSQRPYTIKATPDSRERSTLHSRATRHTKHEEAPSNSRRLSTRSASPAGGDICLLDPDRLPRGLGRVNPDSASRSKVRTAGHVSVRVTQYVGTLKTRATMSSHASYPSHPCVPVSTVFPAFIPPTPQSLPSTRSPGKLLGSHTRGE